MKKIFLIGAILLAFILIFGFYSVSTYNNFISLDQGVKSSWSEVENQYQRQADLIPNLVSVVSSAVSTETKFVKDVISARTAWQSAQTLSDKDQAGVNMEDSVTTFVNAVAENYPDFKANSQYIALTDEMAGTQNRITVARGRYIESIGQYNLGVKKFPSNLLANIFGFSEKEYYSANQGNINTPSLGEGKLP